MFSLIKCPATKAKLGNAHKEPYLMASFSKSAPPVIWYYDLKKAAEAIICLQEKEGEWDLGLKQADGQFASVAHFDERDEAEKAFAVIKKTAMKGRSFSSFGFWLRLVLVVMVVVGVTNFFNEDPTSTQIADTKALTTEKSDAASQDDGPQPMIPGVPMKADDVLTPPAD